MLDSNCSVGRRVSAVEWIFKKGMFLFETGAVWSMT